ncbi:hypothetical protein M9458_002622, partial [Cirrhinus mrigala]
MAGQRFRYRTTLTGDRRPVPRRTSPPPDHGVIFEGLRGSLPQRHNRDLHSMLRRSVGSLHDQEVVKFRRALYRRGDGGRTRETSAEFFRRNPACLHRLVPWLRRELTVLYVQHIIMTLITRHNLDDQAVAHELRPFLLSHTEHFLHEFLSFAQSPFNMEAYDQRAVYDLPRPSGESSSSETSVIAISEDEGDSLVSGSQDYATPSVTLSQTAWDDETPGPSYSSEPSQVLPFHVRDSDSDSSVGEAVVSVAAVPHQDRPANTATIAVEEEEEHSSGSDEDCVIVGYVKPVSERTPELVLLSSDSEQSEQNAELRSPRAPQHIRFTSESDLSPTNTQRPLRRPTRCTRSPENTSKNTYGTRHHERELSGSRDRSSHSSRTHSSSRSRNHPSSKEGKHKRRREKETIEGEAGTVRTEVTQGAGLESTIPNVRTENQLFQSTGQKITSSSSNHQHRRRSRSNSRINSSSSHHTSRHDEHGRKKKYKTKHHEERSGKSSSKLFTELDDAKKKKKKHHKKLKRKSRSPSREDKSEGHSRKHHKKKKKHKRKSRRHNSDERVEKSSPVLITITSDCDSDSADPSEPSTSNICATGSVVRIANNATETQPLMKSPLLKLNVVLRVMQGITPRQINTNAF